MKSAIIALRQRKIELMKSAKAIMATADADRSRTDLARKHKAFDKTQTALSEVEKQIVVAERELAAEAGMMITPDENSAFAALAHGRTPQENPSAPKRRMLGNIGIKS